jgi:hypothetical protein
MRLRTFYRITLVLPLAALALVAAVQAAGAPAEPVLAYGGRASSLYPPFVLRGLIAYALVMIWLNRELRRRPIEAFELLIWKAPLVYVAMVAALLGVLVLAQGQMAEFVEERRRWIAFRLVAHLLIGFGYVGLVTSVRNLLGRGGFFTSSEEPSPVAVK